MLKVHWIPVLAIGCATSAVAPSEVEVDVPASAYTPTDLDGLSGDEVRGALWERVFALEALEVVEIGDLIVDVPEEAICAYSWSPCAGHEDEVERGLREVLPALDELLFEAERAVATASANPTTCSEGVTLANLEALADLQIVVVGDLLVAEPERNCPYLQPCDEDIEVAEATTCERADALHRIAAATAHLR